MGDNGKAKALVPVRNVSGFAPDEVDVTKPEQVAALAKALNEGGQPDKALQLVSAAGPAHERLHDAQAEQEQLRTEGVQTRIAAVWDVSTSMARAGLLQRVQAGVPEIVDVSGMEVRVNIEVRSVFCGDLGDKITVRDWETLSDLVAAPWPRTGGGSGRYEITGVALLVALGLWPPSGDWREAFDLYDCPVADDLQRIFSFLRGGSFLAHGSEVPSPLSEGRGYVLIITDDERSRLCPAFLRREIQRCGGLPSGWRLDVLADPSSRTFWAPLLRESDEFASVSGGVAGLLQPLQTAMLGAVRERQRKVEHAVQEVLDVTEGAVAQLADAVRLALPPGDDAPGSQAIQL